MKKQISIALAAGLLVAGISAASATEVPSRKVLPQRTYGHHDVYANHSKGEQHAAFHVQRDTQMRNVDID